MDSMALDNAACVHWSKWHVSIGSNLHLPLSILPLPMSRPLAPLKAFIYSIVSWYNFLPVLARSHYSVPRYIL